MSSEYKTQSGKGDPFEQFSSFMQPSLEMFTRMIQPMLSASASMIEMQSKMWHTAAEASREWCDFVSKRLEKDAELMEQLCTSQNPQALMDNCTRFSRRMAKDYQEEFSELSRLSGKAADGTRDAMRQAGETMTAFSGDPDRS